MATSGHPDMQISPASAVRGTPSKPLMSRADAGRIGKSPTSGSAGHEGSIPFARSNQKHQVNGHHRTLAG